MSEIYIKAVNAARWINEQTTYRSNNITADFFLNTKEKYGGMFGVSNYDTKESVGILTGLDLLEFAKQQGYKTNE